LLLHLLRLRRKSLGLVLCWWLLLLLLLHAHGHAHRRLGDGEGLRGEEIWLLESTARPWLEVETSEGASSRVAAHRGRVGWGGHLQIQEVVRVAGLLRRRLLLLWLAVRRRIAHAPRQRLLSLGLHLHLLLLLKLSQEFLLLCQLSLELALLLQGGQVVGPGQIWIGLGGGRVED
jgi:hypothetical protein